MILAVMNSICAIAHIEAWKIHDFNGVCTRDLAIPARCSNQLSYEATDVGSWSFVGSNKPIKNECEVIYEIFHIIIELWMWNQAKILTVMNAIYATAYIEDWKIQDFNGVWNCDLVLYIQDWFCKTIDR